MLWKLLVQSVKPYQGLFGAVLVFQLAQSIANLYLPGLNADIIDKGVVTGDTGYIWERGGIMLALSFVQAACAIAGVYFGAKLAMRVGRDLRAAVFHRVGTFSENEVQHFGAPSLITRSTNDVQQVQMLVLMSATLLVSTPFMAVGGVIMALRQDAGLSWILVVAVPVLLLGLGLVISRMVPHFRRMQKRIDQVNKVMREQLTGIRVIRAFVREDQERERFAKASGDVMDSALAAGRLMAIMFPMVMAVMNLGSAAVLWWGASKVGVGPGDLGIGALFAFLTYLIQILMSVMMATFLFVMVPRAAVAADRIGEVLDTQTTVSPPAHPVTDMPTPGTIEFKDVTFNYPGAEQPVVSGVSFLAKPGTTTAIIGSTGAGKTTLLHLIPRLYDVSSGTVLVGGVDVRELDMDTMWADIGLVPQRPYLFSGTIGSTLRYGKSDATDDELWEALTVAQARDFVEEMPDQLESAVAQGGTTVSGGQRQRLSIARALVRKPHILLFDDSFSALDTATDARLRGALNKAVAESTVIIVGQRVSSIMHADQILVMEDGVVIDRGTHAELLETSATYQEIVSTQLRAEEAA